MCHAQTSCVRYIWMWMWKRGESRICELRKKASYFLLYLCDAEVAARFGIVSVAKGLAGDREQRDNPFPNRHHSRRGILDTDSTPFFTLYAVRVHVGTSDGRRRH